MLGRDAAGPSQTRVPRGLSHKEAHELGRQNAIIQLQRDVQTLTARLTEVMARYRDDPEGPRGRERV